MMHPNTRRPWNRRVIGSLSVALFLAVGFAEPPPGKAQARGDEGIPRQLWKTYPLDPSQGNARAADRPGNARPSANTGKEHERDEGPPPTSSDPPVSTGPDVQTAEEQPPGVGGGDSRLLPALPLLALAFLGLFLLVLVSLSLVGVGGGVPNSLAWRRVRALPSSAASRGAPLAAPAGVFFAARNRVVAVLAQAGGVIVARRFQIVFYGVFALVSAATGVAVALLTSRL